MKRYLFLSSFLNAIFLLPPEDLAPMDRSRLGHMPEWVNDDNPPQLTNTVEKYSSEIHLSYMDDDNLPQLKNALEN